MNRAELQADLAALKRRRDAIQAGAYLDPKRTAELLKIAHDVTKLERQLRRRVASTGDRDP